MMIIHTGAIVMIKSLVMLAGMEQVGCIKSIDTIMSMFGDVHLVLDAYDNSHVSYFVTSSSRYGNFSICHICETPAPAHVFISRFSIIHSCSCLSGAGNYRSGVTLEKT
jgi:hypothetical protein